MLLRLSALLSVLCVSALSFLIFYFLVLLRSPEIFISLLPCFVASFCCSNTTTGIALPAAADSAPVPPPRKMHPKHKCLDVASQHGPVFHTSSAGLVATVAPRCEFPATQNPVAWPARLKSDHPIAAPCPLLPFFFASQPQHSSEISLTSLFPSPRLI